MIGVTPLPALMNRSCFGAGRRAQNALDVAQRDDRSRARFANQEGRHLARVDLLGCDADQPVLAVGVRGQRVRTPVPHAVDVDADSDELAWFVSGPAIPGLDQDRGGIVGLVADLLDPPPQLPGRPQRVDHLQVVVWQQRRAQGAQDAQRPTLDRMNVRRSSLFRHVLGGNIQSVRSLSNSCQIVPSQHRRPRSQPAGRPEREGCPAPCGSS